MKQFTECPGLEQLPDLVREQRRMVAGKLRIRREQTQIHERMEDRQDRSAQPDRDRMERSKGQLKRVEDRDKDLREQIDNLLAGAGVDCVECIGFEVRRHVNADGRNLAIVNRIR